ncbi:hypothetical protein EJ08DRAFT_665279 [Tothia fuscella]|uniref:Uncharacterized protein n=1 Tax=Tothia fuscella TaxID=1048955 RepID=A0A9P4NH30_9PEZI|nr:hypothetical protein EJ08DRAFT_665279 [Tothia fuscella]
MKPINNETNYSTSSPEQNTTMTQPKGLLDLPAHIFKDIALHSGFPTSCRIILKSQQRPCYKQKGRCTCKSIQCQHHCRTSIILPLFQVNQQFNEICTHIFYGTNELVLDFWNGYATYAIVQKLRPQTLKAVRKLMITLDSRRRAEDGRAHHIKLVREILATHLTPYEVSIRFQIYATEIGEVQALVRPWTSLPPLKAARFQYEHMGSQQQLKFLLWVGRHPVRAMFKSLSEVMAQKDPRTISKPRSSPLFPLLPSEIRFQILSYAANDYAPPPPPPLRVKRLKNHSKKPRFCCGQCGSQPSRRYPSCYCLSDMEFSSTCTCNSKTTALAGISRSLRPEALKLLYPPQHQFRVSGSMAQVVRQLRYLTPEFLQCMHRLRIELDEYTDDVWDWARYQQDDAGSDSTSYELYDVYDSSSTAISTSAGYSDITPSYGGHYEKNSASTFHIRDLLRWVQHHCDMEHGLNLNIVFDSCHYRKIVFDMGYLRELHDDIVGFGKEDGTVEGCVGFEIVNYARAGRRGQREAKRATVWSGGRLEEVEEGG